MNLWDRPPAISLGRARFLWLFTRTIRISRREARAHMHVLGKTGSGKSYFLAGLFLAF
jgi:DNA helicase HerA-like ATPase